ncbi:MAG: UDP-N-acetylmuramoyl-L-alanyl-D-glutamate--2,6-diaminopimelate ligase [Brevinema sp.]
MLLSLLFPGEKIMQDREILDITNDSRKASEDTLFIAYTGFEKDLHQYISNAYENGCRTFLIDEKRATEFQNLEGIFFTAKNLKQESAQLIHKFYGHPDQEMCIIGVTGTNGKTTTATLINKALQKLGHETLFFGTVEWSIGSVSVEAPNTTPDLIELMSFLRKAVDQGIKYLVMEVASHALSMGRVEDVSFDAVCFTNLTQDHLDYHGDFESYFAAKKYLFTHLLARSTKLNKKAFINVDDTYGQRLADILMTDKIPFATLSMEKTATCRVDNIIQSVENTSFTIQQDNEILDIESDLLGLFNVYNLSMAIMVLMHLGIEEEAVLEAIGGITVAGRLEKYISPNNVTFLIDYAHTPDALEKAVETVQATLSPNNKSLIVFGAGGDRDPIKRPLMAQAVAKGNIIIATSDNPRTEDPEKILDDVMKGFADLTNVHREIDRAKAIKLAYSLANSGDVILIAGKGHENYQIIGKEKIHFSDLEEAKKVSE